MHERPEPRVQLPACLFDSRSYVYRVTETADIYVVDAQMLLSRCEASGVLGGTGGTVRIQKDTFEVIESKLNE